jgi:hypothetical protein
MKNIKIYELWGDEDSEKEEGVELLSRMVEASKKDIVSHFNSRLMDVDFVEVSDPQQFVVEYWPKSFDSRIPQRISYYIDDIAEILSEEFGTKINWQFSPNGNVQRIEFDLDKEIDPKYFSAKDRMKFS